MNREHLNEMSGVDIMEIDETRVAAFDEALSLSQGTPAQAVEQLCSKGYNPYFRKEKSGGCIVKISFTNNGVRLSDAVAAMLGNG